MMDDMTNVKLLAMCEEAYKRIPVMKNRQQAKRWLQWLRNNVNTSDAFRFREMAMLLIGMSSVLPRSF